MSAGALLVGGPYHGRRMAVPPEQTSITVIATQPLPRSFYMAKPTRPPLWKPVKLVKWHRKPAPVPKLPDFHQLLYRYQGTLQDRTRLFVYSGQAINPPANANEVMHHFYRALSECDPISRAKGHWEMGANWYTALRVAMSLERGDPNPGDMFMGMPAEVVGDTGAPRIVEYPQKSAR